MNNSSAMGFVLVAIAGCVMFACLGAAASMILTDNAATAADTISDALASGNAEQSNRAVCVAGLFNFDSCNTSQAQTWTRPDDTTNDTDAEKTDPLLWSARAIAGLAIICGAGVLMSFAGVGNQ